MRKIAEPVDVYELAKITRASVTTMRRFLAWGIKNDVVDYKRDGNKIRYWACDAADWEIAE